VNTRFQRRFLVHLVRRLRRREEQRDDWLCRIGRAYEHEIQHEMAYLAGRNFILRLLSRPAWLRGQYYLANQLVQVTIYRIPAAYERMREVSSLLAENEPPFLPIRSKIHSNPEAQDLRSVEEYRASHRVAPASVPLLDELATLLRHERSEQDLPARLDAVIAAGVGRRLTVLASALREHVANDDLRAAFRCGAELSLAIRRALMRRRDPEIALQLLTLNVRLQQLSRAEWSAPVGGSRSHLLEELLSYHRYATAAGLLSFRQLDALDAELRRVRAGVDIATYRASVQYLNRALGWCVASIVRGLDLWTLDAEQVALRDELTRSSIALPMSLRLDALTADANALAQVGCSVLGAPATGMVVGLSSGVAVGPLVILDRERASPPPNARAIVVLPMSAIEAPPAAGMLTLDTASQLSHVHLLARSLAIPHASVPSSFLPRLRQHEGRDVVLAVTSRGSVALRTVGEGERLHPPERPRVSLDATRLNLAMRCCVPIADLSVADAGVIAGPKAAWLGELARRFGPLVPPGVVVPFAAFEDHLRQIGPDGATAVDVNALLNGHRIESEGSLSERLAAIREQIQARPLVRWVEDSLIETLDRTIGRTWRQRGVFVRSAMNAEDAADFNAAGLYATIAHQVGVEAVTGAVRAVWASAFSERAFGWRDRVVSGSAAAMPSVLVMPSIAVQKSGVLITADLETGAPDRWTVSTGEGVGAAVSDSTSEQLTVGGDGRIRLQQEATSPVRTTLRRTGGVTQTLASIRPRVLSDRDLATLHDFVRALVADLGRRPIPGCPPPWEVEFGFYGRRLYIFQLRPFAPARAQTLAEEIVGEVEAEASGFVTMEAAIAGAGATDDAWRAHE
jgi:hypothetical protein